MSAAAWRSLLVLICSRATQVRTDLVHLELGGSSVQQRAIEPLLFHLVEIGRLRSAEGHVWHAQAFTSFVVEVPSGSAMSALSRDQLEAHAANAV